MLKNKPNSFTRSYPISIEMQISLILPHLSQLNKVNEQNLLHVFENNSFYFEILMTLIAE